MFKLFCFNTLYVLSTLHKLASKHLKYAHFTEEETETQKDESVISGGGARFKSRQPILNLELSIPCWRFF